MIDTPPPHIEDDELENADTDPSGLEPVAEPEPASASEPEIDPDERSAHVFAGLVRNMLEEKLEPICSRLDQGDRRFDRIEKAMYRMIDEVTAYKAAVDMMAVRLTRLEGAYRVRFPDIPTGG